MAEGTSKSRKPTQEEQLAAMLVVLKEIAGHLSRIVEHNREMRVAASLNARPMSAQEKAWAREAKKAS